MKNNYYLNVREYLKKHFHFHLKQSARRLFLLVVLFIASFFIHRVLSGFQQEIIGSFILIFLFSIGLFFDFISLFRKEVPKIEYFLNMLFIIIFTILMFSVVYSERLRSGNSYFIENGNNITKLPFADAIYFSTTTLTTVTYGDVLPVGAFRYFALIEIFMGLIYIGTLVYIITSHLDKRRNE